MRGIDSQTRGGGLIPQANAALQPLPLAFTQNISIFANQLGEAAMTKSKGVGRGAGSGGKRPGAGRKRNRMPTGSASNSTSVVAPGPSTDGEIHLDALVKTAFRVLQDVMENSPFPSPRVAAAKLVIAQGQDTLAPSGKRSRRQEAAKVVANKGRFATPPGPRLVVDND